jgi:hypothetical protein
VTRADPLGVHGARVLLELWQRQLGAPEERMALVVTGHDARRHHAPAAIAWHLRVPLAAVLPEDRAALHRAQLVREPALFARGRYADAVLAFADRACGGSVRLPEEVQRARRRWSFRLPRRRVAAPVPAQEGGLHDGDAVPAS